MLQVAIFIGALVALVILPLSTVAQAEPGETELAETVFIPLGDLRGGRAASSALGVAVVRSDHDERVAVELDGSDVGGGTPLRLTNENEFGALIVGDSSSAETGSNAREAFVWSEDEGMLGLGSLEGGSFLSYARAISRDSAAIVGASSSASTGSNGLEAFMLDHEGVWSLGDLPGGQYRSEAFDVSLGGDFVVGSSSSRSSGANSTEAFLWSYEDGMLGLGSLSGGQFRSVALGISDEGDTVVGWSSSSRTGANSGEAFEWSHEDGLLGLGSLEGGQFRSEARDVSSDGSRIVGASSSRRSGSNATEAFIWTQEEGMTGLGFLPGGIQDSEANAVTSDGEVVVGRSRTPSMNDAFIWDDENGMRSIFDLLQSGGQDLRGWQLLSATDVVRAPGAIVIVGNALNPRQIEEAWVASISMVPEPSTMETQMAALFALAALTRYRTRSRRHQLQAAPSGSGL